MSAPSTTLPLRSLTALVGGARTLGLLIVLGAVSGLMAWWEAPVPSLMLSSAPPAPVLGLLAVIPAAVAVRALAGVPAWWTLAARRPLAHVQLSGLVVMLLCAAVSASVSGGLATGICLLRDSLVLLALGLCVRLVATTGAATAAMLASALLSILLGNTADGRVNPLGIALMGPLDPRGLASAGVALLVMERVLPVLARAVFAREGLLEDS